MAVDKLVDSAILNACCTAEANAIRAKTGGSSQIAYDFANSKGFADAITAIPSGSAPRLPSAYQEVEYIQTDGNAYINTGYQFSGKAKIELKAYRPSGTWYIFGGADSSPARLQIYSTGNTDLYCASPGTSNYYSVTLSYSSVISSLGHDITICLLSKSGYLCGVDPDNVVGKSTNKGEEISISKPAFLFRFNHYNNPASHNAASGTRAYYLKIWDGANFDLVRDLVPCYRKADGVIGMYDLAGSGEGNDLTDNNFFVNAASSGGFSSYPSPPANN